MPRYALELEMSGSYYHGTAVQPEVPTLQGDLERILSHLDDRRAQVRLAGRLDAGVAAAALVVHSDLERIWDPRTLGRALNGHLGEHAQVLRAAVAPAGFDALLSCTGKTYTYALAVRDPRPVRDCRVWWRKRLRHPERLAACAALLPGQRNLAAFACRRGDPSDDADPTRRIDDATWNVTPNGPGQRYVFTICGEGFLYKQVRGLVGAMVGVAAGMATVADFATAVAAGWDHPRIGSLAPPDGLMLLSASHDPMPAWLDLA
jgi:tRNA pseudouridine38-40 synthase